MRVAIVGSRNFPDLVAVRQYVRTLSPEDVVISGGAGGPDSIAVDEANLLGLKIEVYLPDWKGLGRGAGMARNRRMIVRAERVVAFWDGESPGTRHSMTLAQQLGKPLHVVTMKVQK